MRFEYFRRFTKDQYLYLGVLLSFIVIAAVISSNYSRDTAGYNHYISMFGSYGWNNFFTEALHIEPFFLFVSKIIYQSKLDYFFVFLIFASISLPVKFYLVSEHSKDRYLSLAYFASYFFILHDCTQLRFGMAVAFVYLGLHYLADNRKLVFCAIVALSAILFHNAILIFLIMLFFTTRKSLSIILGMVLVAIILYPVDIHAVLYDLIGNIDEHFGPLGTRLNKLQNYLLKPTSEFHLGIFSRHGLLIYFFAAAIFQYRNKFNAFETLCYNAYMLSIFFWILLKDAMVLQVRFNDVLGFSMVFLIPYLHRRLSEYVSERNAYILLILFFIAYLAKFIFHDKMVAL